MQLILASNSPRRRELLSEWKIPFLAVPSRFEEKGEGLSAEETVSAFAEGKAREVFSRYPGAFVLGADTVVAFEGEILGKPADAEDAKSMLRRLSGKTHTVYSGVCLIGKDFFRKGIARTDVTFYNLPVEMIEEYVAGGKPLDKAGAYGIQDGYPIVRSYQGSYTNVVGLPEELVRAFLKEGNIC